jgi:sarcosine oxidase subunit beta
MPDFSNSNKPDVLIIGGGVIGCSIAYNLTQRGCQNVVVIERNTLGSGSTSKAAGGIRQQFSSESNVRISMYSVDFFEHFQARLGLEAHESGVDFHQVGYLFLLSTDSEMETFRQNVAMQQRLGLPVELLTPQEAAKLCPGLYVDDLLGATFCPTDGYGNPHDVTQAFAKVARRQGARILEGVEVNSIERQGSQIIAVETSAGTFYPEVVVGCAGAWSGKLGQMCGVDIPVQPLRRMGFVTDPFDELLHTAPMTIDMHNSFHFRPEGPGFFLGESDPNEPYGFNEVVKWEWLDTVVEDAIKRVPAFERARIRNGWAGFYDTSPDHNAILGRIPELTNFFVATGFSGHGFMQSPAVGLVLSEFILDGAAHTIDVSDLSIDRFKGGNLNLERNVI